MTPNAGMAHLSDTLFTTAIAVYATAMVGFTAEYAFGRRGRIAHTAGSVRTPAPTLAGVAGEQSQALPESDDADQGSGWRSDERSPSIERSSERGTLPDRIGRAAIAITIVGALIHAASVTVRAGAVDAVPWSNMYEFASVAGLIGVVAFVLLLWKAPQVRHLGGFVLLPVIVMMFLAGTVLYSVAQPLVPALQSYWLAIHVILAAVSEGALMTSAVLTVLYLLKQRYARLSDQPGRRLSAAMTFAGRLPSAASLDKVAYRVVAFAFPLYTVGIICGAIWAEAAWGRYWGWDPKETWAFIVWVLYACYLHARATAGWKGRAAAWVNLAGFAAITFNFFMVNIVISGLHSYAGLS